MSPHYCFRARSPSYQVSRWNGLGVLCRFQYHGQRFFEFLTRLSQIIQSTVVRLTFDAEWRSEIQLWNLSSQLKSVPQLVIRCFALAFLFDQYEPHIEILCACDSRKIVLSTASLYKYRLSSSNCCTSGRSVFSTTIVASGES